MQTWGFNLGPDHHCLKSKNEIPTVKDDHEFLQENKTRIFEMINERKEIDEILNELKHSKDDIKNEISIKALMSFLGSDYDISGSNPNYTIVKINKEIEYFDPYIQRLMKMVNENRGFYSFFEVYDMSKKGYHIKPNMKNTLNLLFSQGYYLDENSYLSRFKKMEPSDGFSDYQKDCDLFLEKKKSQIFQMIELKVNVFDIIKELTFSKDGNCIRLSLRDLLNFLGDEYDLDDSIAKLPNYIVTVKKVVM